jgi:putative hydrolase of the HAD superfamily
MLRHILFDLDNTLYPQDSGLWEAIGERINQYMIERVGFQPEEVRARRDAYMRAHGTTLTALRRHHGVHARDFLDYVHDLPLRNFLSSHPELDGMLQRLPLQKTIFSNADEPHVRRVLAQLGIARHFSRIIDIYALDFISKPDPRAYHRVLELIRAEPSECILVEDTPANLPPAQELGIITVLIGGREGMGLGKHRIRQITDLEPLIARLLAREQES